MVRRSGHSKRSSASDSHSAVPTTFTDGQPLPKLIVFDLDYTLWPFWIDTHCTPPLKSKDDGLRAEDGTGESLTFYPQVPSILHAARQTKPPISLGLASRTHTPDLAIQLLKILHVHPPRASGEGGTSTTDSSISSAADQASPTTPATPKRALDFFAHREIYPGDKRAHMKGLHRTSGAAFEEMLFFDDEHRNGNVEGLGVCFWLVRDGVTCDVVDEGVREWRRRMAARAEMETRTS